MLPHTPAGVALVASDHSHEFPTVVGRLQALPAFRRKTQYGITAHVYVVTTSREALSAIEKGQRVGCGREMVHKIADVVLEMESVGGERRWRASVESVGHRVIAILVPFDEGNRGVAEAKSTANSAIDNGSELTVAPAERMRGFSGVLRLVKAERANTLYVNEDDVCAKYYTWETERCRLTRPPS